MNKQEYEELIVKADEVLQDSELFKDHARQKIYKSYNGYVSALGVSVLMIGLVPALSVYYQDNEGICRKKVLDVIAKMLDMDNSGQLVESALHFSSENRKELQCKIVNSSIALKQVVRTYKLVDE